MDYIDGRIEKLKAL